MDEEFIAFQKIPRLHREIVVTEKIDGTNAQVLVRDDGSILAGSRKRWITPEDDNFGFARWVVEHADELRDLGPGRHFGEWWGSGIQRNYSLPERRFSLFNTAKWGGSRPSCCGVVPILYEGEFSYSEIRKALNRLAKDGSEASPGFMDPEGIVIFHKHGNLLFKATIHGDDAPKSVESAAA